MVCVNLNDLGAAAPIQPIRPIRGCWMADNLGWREENARAPRHQKQTPGHAWTSGAAARDAGRLGRLVRGVDASPARRPRARSIAAQGSRSVPAPGHAVEPVEGPQEAG